MIKHPLTTNQKHFVDAYLSGKNIICDAVAGGGKSSTALHAAVQTKDRKTLVLTYNNALAKSFREKLEEMHETSVSHLRVLTYHSAVGVFYETEGAVVKDDMAFDQVLSDIHAGTAVRRAECSRYHTLVIDEAQDMRPMYYQFVSHLLADGMYPDPQLVVLGASGQVLYDFFESECADARFLTKSEELFKGLTSRVWVRCSLDRSHRLTPNIAAFVSALKKRPGSIKGANRRVPDYPVEYVVDNVRTARLASLVCDRIRAYQKEGLGVALLFHSLCGRDARCVVNALTHAHAVRFVLHNGECGRGNETRNVLLSTYHAFKGKEHDAVIVFGIHNHHNASCEEMPHSVNVALTRASAGRLLVIHDYTHPPSRAYPPPEAWAEGVLLRENFPYPANGGADRRGFPVLTEDSGQTTKRKRPSVVPDPVRYHNISAGMRYMDTSTCRALLEHVEVTRARAAAVSTATADFEHPGFDGGRSDLMSAYRSAILFAIEYARTGKCAEVQRTLYKSREFPELAKPMGEVRALYKEKRAEAQRKYKETAVSDWMRMGLFCNAMQGLHYLITQNSEGCEWYQEALVKKIVSVLERVLPAGLVFGVRHRRPETTPNGAGADLDKCVFFNRDSGLSEGTDGTPWVFDLTDELTHEHLIRAAASAWTAGKTACMFVNLCTCETHRVVVGEGFEKVLVTYFTQKGSGKTREKGLSEFLEECGTRSSKRIRVE